MQAEQVELERQIIHHKHEEQDINRKRSRSPDESDDSLPELRLEIDQSRLVLGSIRSPDAHALNEHQGSLGPKAFLLPAGI